MPLKQIKVLKTLHLLLEDSYQNPNSYEIHTLPGKTVMLGGINYTSTKAFFFFFFYKGWAISKAAYTKLGIITCKLHLCTSATVFDTTHLAGIEFSIKPPKVQGGKKLA